MAHEVNPLDELQAYCNDFKSLNEAAASIGVTKQYLSDVLRNKRDLSDRLLKHLRLRRIVVKETK
jgi:plasmid maintenance system antidote protein VapI